MASLDFRQQTQGEQKRSLIPRDETSQSSANPSNGMALWSANGWASAITKDPDMHKSRAALAQEVLNFERTMTKEDQKRYYAVKQDFEKAIKEAKEAQIKREARASRTPWKRSLSSRYAKFCDIAHYYQSLFDVLNNQAPEYTTAVWGAVKLLLLASVNNAKLKDGVIQTLDEVGSHLSLMKVIVELQPSADMVKAVTQVYDTVAAFKAVISPWETRFQHFVKNIEANVARVNGIAALGQNIAVERILDNTVNLGLGQKSIQRRQSAILQCQIGYGETQMAFLRTIAEKADNTISFQQGMKAFVQQIGLDYSSLKHDTATLLAAFQPTVIANTPEVFLAEFVRPTNNARKFFDRVFPAIGVTDQDLNNCLQRYPIEDSTIYTRILQSNPEIFSWIESKQSRLIWVEGSMDRGKSDWSTNFCLEIIGATQSLDQITVLRHFSGEQPLHCSSPGMLLQSILSQLILVHSRAFSYEVCRQQHLTQRRFEEAANDLPELRKLFQQCLYIVKPPCLYVVIDRIDTLYARISRNGEEVERFESLLDFVKDLTMVESIICKIVITSQTPGVHRYLATPFNKVIDPSCHKIVQLPKSAHRDAKIFGRMKRQYRLPLLQPTRDAREGDPALLLTSDYDSDEDVCSHDNGSNFEKSEDGEYDWDYNLFDESHCTKYLVDYVEYSSEDGDEGLPRIKALDQGDSSEDDAELSILPSQDTLSQGSRSMSDTDERMEKKKANSDMLLSANQFAERSEFDYDSDDEAFRLIPRNSSVTDINPNNESKDVVSPNSNNTAPYLHWNDDTNDIDTHGKDVHNRVEGD
ncbi:MAG: hypothetical protein Q9187_004840 [Circinaria calcarea]